MRRGLIPAVYSPFNADYTLNLEAIPNLSRLYKDQGCSAVFINGTTGEFSSMTLNERILLTEAWIDRTTDLSIWVHVGHTCQYESIQLARHAQTMGAAAVSALAPFYFQPPSVEHLIDFLTPIALAANHLPFYYYHIPSMTHVSVDIEAFITKAAEQIPNFSGLKFSSPDLYALQKAQMTAERIGHSIEVLFGVDEMLLGALPFRIDGAIGSTYNFSTPLYRRLLEHYDKSELEQAQALQSLSASVVSEFHQYGGISTGKAILNMLGIHCGPPRPPLAPLSSGQCKTLYQKISPLDIFPHKLQSPETY